MFCEEENMTAYVHDMYINFTNQDCLTSRNGRFSFLWNHRCFGCFTETVPGAFSSEMLQHRTFL